MALKIILRIGETYLLVDESVPYEPLGMDVPARVLNTRAGTLSSPAPAAAILKRSPGFEEYDGDQADIDRLMREVDDVRGPPADEVGPLERFGRPRRRS